METARRATGPAVNASVRRYRILTVIAGAVAGLIVWVIARLALGHDLTSTQPGSDGMTTIGPVAVVLTSLILGLIAWGVLALLERFTGNARRIWTIIAVVVLLLSLAGPLSQANGTGTTIALLLEHLVVGGILILGLLRTVLDRRV